MMIVGNDISGVGQGQIDFSIYKNNTFFVLMKATEGNGIVDPWFGNNRQQARNDNLPRMFYHFLRPDLQGNTPQGEAYFFESYVDGDPIQQYENIGLDVEVNATGLVAYAQAWLENIHSHYNNITIWIYLNQSIAQSYDWSPVIALGYVKLWGAYYTNNPNNGSGANFGQWTNTPLLRQWTNTETVPGINGNVDGDDFNGTVQEFEAYGYQPIVPPSSITPPAPVTSPMPVVPSVTAPVPPVPPIVKPIPSVSPTPVVIKSTPVPLPSAPPNYPWYKWVWQFFLGNIKG
jgi:GH25 family lysozyme M1 (1,4-beta-N-acetylmuramidase)